MKFHALILRLASEHHLPVAGHRKEWVEQGALFSYAENIREVGRAAAAHYVDKILRGAKPADNLHEGVSAAGKGYYTFDLSDGTESVRVFSIGKARCKAGRATVDGTFERVRQQITATRVRCR